MGQSEYAWVGPVMDRIAVLLGMPGMHNSYGTPQVKPEWAWKALDCLAGVLTNISLLPVPVILPTPAGGLEFQWVGPSTECWVKVEEKVKVVSGKAGALKGPDGTGEFEELAQLERLEQALEEIQAEKRAELSRELEPKDK